MAEQSEGREYRAIARNVRIAPRKVRLVADLIRGKNVVQARSFAEMLEQTIRRYQNRAIEAAQVLHEAKR